ncbi:MAG: Flp pilus assembly protein CpaB, partial [Roseiarcus sp.]
LAEAQLMKPSQGGFLAAVLAPSMRAVSITVGAAESVSGLIAPGDHVDVILTQSFESATTESGRKSVGETMLHGVRVVAVDQTLNGGMQPNGIAPVAAQPRIPKTITLEVTEHQAEMLMVATQIGKVDLAMRPYADDAAARQLASSEALNLPPPDDPSPTWASDVSSALRGRNPTPARSASSNAPHSRTLPSIAVMRGSKIETLCSGGDRLEACGESK